MLDRQEVERIALLARLGISEEEAERFREQLSDILENFEVLREVDTTSVLPTSQATGLENVVSEDRCQSSLSQAEVLANAPQVEEGFLRIKAVME